MLADVEEVGVFERRRFNLDGADAAMADGEEARDERGGIVDGDVEDIAVAVDLRNGLQASADGNCLDEKNAAYLENTLNGLLALDHVSGVTIAHQGRALHVEARLSEQDLEALVDRISR